ncbi:DedA-family integral membrane protein [Klebsiella michiganensis]|uniref:DedA-family integral membrane protein n=1 Tax=Klebsiella michiganensis TaxID=1134687 RepID=A0A7H4N021_9ENTR|nr:DedA-family integral membrane protein [Klebsiella michiganensis]
MVFLLTFTKSLRRYLAADPRYLRTAAVRHPGIGQRRPFFVNVDERQPRRPSADFWLSWLTGYRYRHHLHRIRWLNAERLARGQLFLRRHGAWAVFFSRFLSPLRATVPLVTGASGTSLWQFQLANVSSGLLCAAGPAGARGAEPQLLMKRIVF